MFKIVCIGLLFCCIPSVVLIALAVRNYRNSQKTEKEPAVDTLMIQNELDDIFGTPVIQRAARMQ